MQKSSDHGGYGGRTIIQRIEQQMDKRRKKMEKLVVETGLTSHAEILCHTIEKGRYEGMAGALALLRSSTMAIEISRSNERLGIE